MLYCCGFQGILKDHVFESSLLVVTLSTNENCSDFFHQLLCVTKSGFFRFGNSYEIIKPLDLAWPTLDSLSFLSGTNDVSRSFLTCYLIQECNISYL